MTAVSPVFNRAIFVFALLGLLVAGYLWQLHGHPVDIPCGGSHGCLDVATSKYSEFPPGSGLPVAMYGAVAYLGIAVLALLRTLSAFAAQDRLLQGLISLAAVFGTAASFYLTYLEIAVIHAICRWCVGSQIIILVIAILALTERALRAAKARADRKAEVGA